MWLRNDINLQSSYTFHEVENKYKFSFYCLHISPHPTIILFHPINTIDCINFSQKFEKLTATCIWLHLYSKLRCLRECACMVQFWCHIRVSALPKSMRSTEIWKKKIENFRIKLTDFDISDIVGKIFPTRFSNFLPFLRGKIEFLDHFMSWISNLQLKIF